MVEKARVRVFVDFWNFQIQWNQCHTRLGAKNLIQIPWKDVLPTVLTSEAAKGQPAKFAGIHVYASVDKNRRTRTLAAGCITGLPALPDTLLR